MYNFTWQDADETLLSTSGLVSVFIWTMWSTADIWPTLIPLMCHLELQLMIILIIDQSVEYVYNLLISWRQKRMEKMHKRDIIAFFVKQIKTQRYLIYNEKKKGANTNTQIWEVGARNCLALLMVVLTFTHFDFEPQLVCSTWWQMMKQDCGVSNAPLVFSWLSWPTKANFHERKVTGNQSQVSNNKKSSTIFSV